MSKKINVASNQELIDFENARIAELEVLIAQKNQQKLDINSTIDQLEANINYFQQEQANCDTQIASYTDDITKITEIIAIIEANS